MTAVAVLTDPDTTGESIEAWYGDISFRPNTLWRGRGCYDACARYAAA